MLQAAAIAVPAELGEDEILVAVVLRAGRRARRPGVAALVPRAPGRHKVPRYVAFVDALPHTPTHRVAKYRLRAESGALIARAVDLDAPA